MLMGISSIITTMILIHVHEFEILLIHFKELFKPNWIRLMIFHQKFNSLLSNKDPR